jgi:Delta7-sterol 5-desaturase
MEKNMNSELLQLLQYWLERYTGTATRGFVILGSLYLIFWVFKRPWMDKYRVQTLGSHQPKPLKEAYYTFTTYMVYAAAAVIVAVVAKKTGHSMVYTNVAQYGWFYTLGSFFIFAVWTDTAFFWSHLLMHKNRKLYRISHATHHQFINVTPWAAYAFHTGEAIINAGAFLALMLLVPWHPLALLVFAVMSIAFNGVVHSGYDLFPKRWREHPVLKLVNTPTHHIYHHQRPDCNYSFFFTFWDKVMKTEKLPESYYKPREEITSSSPEPLSAHT